MRVKPAWSTPEGCRRAVDGQWTGCHEVLEMGCGRGGWPGVQVVGWLCSREKAEQQVEGRVVRVTTSDKTWKAGQQRRSNTRLGQNSVVQASTLKERFWLLIGC